jgi:hypothetical protein
MALSEFKTLVREQFAMLLIDEKAALAALPSLLPADSTTRSEAFNAVKQVTAARGEVSAADEKRLSEIGRLFGIGEEGATSLSPKPKGPSRERIVMREPAKEKATAEK